jgi:hypothetical protein
MSDQMKQEEMLQASPQFLQNNYNHDEVVVCINLSIALANTHNV